MVSFLVTINLAGWHSLLPLIMIMRADTRRAGFKKAVLFTTEAKALNKSNIDSIHYRN